MSEPLRQMRETYFDGRPQKLVSRDEFRGIFFKLVEKAGLIGAHFIILVNRQRFRIMNVNNVASVGLRSVAKVRLGTMHILYHAFRVTSENRPVYGLSFFLSIMETVQDQSATDGEHFVFVREKKMREEMKKKEFSAFQNDSNCGGIEGKVVVLGRGLFIGGSCALLVAVVLGLRFIVLAPHDGRSQL